jgi:hypothetical protein
MRINHRLLEKFKYIADSEGRSANRELEQYIKRRIAAYEEKHGEIPVKDADDAKDAAEPVE